MKKTIYIIIAIVVICIIVVLLGKSNPSGNIIKTNANTVENEVSNTVKNEMHEDEIQNEVEGNVVEEETNKNTIDNTVSSETFTESPQTAEEKAINLVKKDWGQDNNVKFSVEGINQNGYYIVVVRNNSTEALAFYTVDLNNQTFTKREMN